MGCHRFAVLGRSHENRFGASIVTPEQRQGSHLDSEGNPNLCCDSLERKYFEKLLGKLTKVPPIAIIETLDRVFNVFREYLQTVTEETLSENSVLIYQVSINLICVKKVDG